MTPAYQWGAKIAQHLIDWDLPATPADCLNFLHRTENITLNVDERAEFIKGVRSVNK